MKQLKDILRESTQGLSEEDTKDFIVDLLIDIYGAEALDEEGNFQNPALDIIVEMVEVLSGSALDHIAHIIDETYQIGLFDEEGSEMEVPEELVGEEYDEEEELDEGIPSQRDRRMRAIKMKKKKILGKKSSTLSFKRNFYFDKKKRKFVRRKKSMSVTTIRKKAKRLKKLARRGSTKAKVKRTKKRLSHMAKIRV